MELKHPDSPQAVQDEALEAVVAKIRPLPENVVPSERFREQMRLRLLQLQPERRQAAPSRAA